MAPSNSSIFPSAHIDVAVDAPGFKKFVAKDVVSGHRARRCREHYPRSGRFGANGDRGSEAAQVETTSTQLGAVMNDVAVTELPLSTRNTYQLLQLQPGVQSQVGADLFYGSGFPGVVSVNGGRGRSNNYMVNGGDGNDIFVNVPAIQPSPDAIEEFRVLTNTFRRGIRAQFGLGGKRGYEIRNEPDSWRFLRIFPQQRAQHARAISILRCRTTSKISSERRSAGRSRRTRHLFSDRTKATGSGREYRPGR